MCVGGDWSPLVLQMIAARHVRTSTNASDSELVARAHKNARGVEYYTGSEILSMAGNYVFDSRGTIVPLVSRPLNLWRCNYM